MTPAELLVLKEAVRILERLVPEAGEDRSDAPTAAQIDAGGGRH